MPIVAVEKETAAIEKAKERSGDPVLCKCAGKTGAAWRPKMSDSE